MPSYDFKCKDCDQRFTVRVPMDQRHQVICSHCQSSKVQQLLTGFFYARPAGAGGSPGGGGSSCSGGSCSGCSGC